MTKEEIKAEVFKVIRANQEKSKSKIIGMLHEHLPDCSKDEIIEALLALSD